MSCAEVEHRRARRWPAWIYGAGTEPDPRFTFANERTFLAWLRTSLALIVGGVALDTFDTSLDEHLATTMAILLLLMGLACASVSWVRWARAERALRRGQPLPGTPLSLVLTLGTVAAAVVTLTAMR